MDVGHCSSNHRGGQSAKSGGLQYMYAMLLLSEYYALHRHPGVSDGAVPYAIVRLLMCKLLLELSGNAGRMLNPSLCN